MYRRDTAEMESPTRGKTGVYACMVATKRKAARRRKGAECFGRQKSCVDRWLESTWAGREKLRHFAGTGEHTDPS